ncbi:MAG: GGDEF domain-containing protein [Elusimicrobia bacterium]|nr:GGDEF domain-containing protein [Candidatus Liberimonas magnetica]
MDTLTNNLELIKVLDEFKHLQQTMIDTRIVEIIAGDRVAGSEDEQRISEIKDRLKNKFYTFLLYTITHEIAGDEKKAQMTIEKIIEHKWNLSIALKRNIGIHVAALDFLKNISTQLRTPTIVSEDKFLTLAKAATQDKMTHTFDRILLLNDLQKEIERSKRYNSFFSTLMVDIDDFKSFNDKYGHQFGDVVIMAVSELLNKSVRISDSVYRFGGDEFIVLLLNTSREDGIPIANKIMTEFDKLAIHNDQTVSDISISVSMSFASYDNTKLTTAESMVSLLDAALLKAKSSGKRTIFECSDKDTCRIVRF